MSTHKSDRRGGKTGGLVHVKDSISSRLTKIDSPEVSFDCYCVVDEFSKRLLTQDGGWVMEATANTGVINTSSSSSSSSSSSATSSPSSGTEATAGECVSRELVDVISSIFDGFVDHAGTFYTSTPL